MSLDDFHRLIDTYIDEDRMFYLVVGLTPPARGQAG